MLYQVYGLCLSCPFPLPGFSPLPVEQSIDLNINHGRPAQFQSEQITALPPWYISQELGDSGQPQLKIWQLKEGKTLYLRFASGLEFWLDSQGRQLWMEWTASTLEDALTYLLETILVLVLHLQGVASLHANVFAVAGQAVLLVGDSGAGKSTTSAFLASRGYPIASDDIAPLLQLDQTIWVQSGLPSIRLCQDAVNYLFGDEKALPPVSPSWDKRCLHLHQQNYSFQIDPLPLGAIYILNGRRNESSAPRIEKMTSIEAFLTLNASLHTANLPDRPMRSKFFALFSHILHQVPVRRVIPHTSIAYLANMCDLILADFHSHSLPAAPSFPSLPLA